MSTPWNRDALSLLRNMPKHGILAAVNAQVSMANTASIDIEIRSFDDIGEEPSRQKNLLQLQDVT